MKWIYLTTFIVFSCLHLFASLQKNNFFRGVTKGFILFSLIGYYVSSIDPGNINWFLIAALLTSFIGDMFLIPKGTNWFVVGGISFLISHILFCLTYNSMGVGIKWGSVPVYAIVLILLFFIGVVFSIFFICTRKFLVKPLFVPLLCYLAINGTMNSFAMFRLIGSPSAATALTCVGALLFFVSDSTLIFVRFDKNSKINSHFLVMLTYILGEFLIVQGLMLG